MMEVQDGKSFMGNWMCIQTLGEGSYGEVKLLKHQRSGDCIAVKIVNLKKHKDADDCVKKEVQIQAALNHPNIIRYYGRKREVEQKLHYIYLEYASGGELFNRIEPDHGMPYRDAQKYMKQLLSGVEYLHQKGVTHRDIKPENLLLDQHGNLKIIDFGMATIFRFKGKERLLDKKCGTLPYVAPEVLHKSYLAQPADIWSCGIVLVAMVGGELPWTEPLISCAEYKDWITDQYLLNSPWRKLNNTILSLARKILTPDTSNRPSIQQILKHPWMLTSFTENEATGSVEEQKDNWDISDKEILFTGVTLSQPMPCKVSKPEDFSELLKNRDDVYFSQPVQNDSLFICSQAKSTQASLVQNDFRHLIRRITRFFVTTSCEKTVEALGSLLDRLHYTWNTDNNGVFTITTVDNRKMQLIFKANIINMDGKLLLDFILTKGCGLEFKRRFIKIKRCLNEILLQ